MSAKIVFCLYSSSSAIPLRHCLRRRDTQRIVCTWKMLPGGDNSHCAVTPLSSTGSILSNTDLSDLSTVGTCDIFVYQMRHRVMWFARLADSILFIKRVITFHWNGFMKMPCGECFQKCFSANNMISLWLNTVIPIIVMIWLPNMTRYLQWRIIYSHLTLVTF